MLEEYKIKRYAEENVIIMDTIRIIMPSYDKKNDDDHHHQQNKRNFLSYEIEGMKGMVF
jgi:hypothetical protein